MEKLEELGKIMFSVIIDTLLNLLIMTRSVLNSCALVRFHSLGLN